jgi:hypothetical protein
VWQYGTQLWGCSKIININIIQKFQNKVLRGIVDTPCYVRNSDLHRDLNIESVTYQGASTMPKSTLLLMLRGTYEILTYIEI